MSDINAQQQGRVGITLVEHLAGVQQHGASADAGKLMFDLIILHYAMLRHDFFQQQPKPGNVPLTVPQCVKQPALGVGPADLERQIERAACSEHAQVLAEHQKRFPDGVDDRLSERAGVVIFDERMMVPHGVPLGDSKRFRDEPA